MSITTPAEVRTLQLVLRAVGAIIVVAFVATLAAVLLDIQWIINEHESVIGGMAAWSDTEGYAYLVIMSLTYIPWGIYLWRAAEDPAANRSLISFTVVANLCIGVAMLLIALVDADHRLHLVGDIPFTFVVTGVLLWAWRRADAALR